MPNKAILRVLLVYSLIPFQLSAQEGLFLSFSHLLHQRSGAILVLNPSTGEVLAAWNLRDALDRAIPLGSTAKLVAATAALEEGLISPDDRILCRRVPRLLGGPFRCAHPPAGEAYPLASALAYSCNYYFAELSARLSSNALARWYAAFGFGQPLDALDARHAAGLVRIGESDKAKARAAVGESTILATPVQLLLAYSAVATGGSMYRLWRRSAKPAGAPTLARRVRMQMTTLATLRAGFKQCAESGTCRGAAVPGVEVAGKTGTATAPRGSHAWFVGYAPADQPQVAIVVFLEHGTGAADAAPVAGQILREYFASKGTRR